MQPLDQVALGAAGVWVIKLPAMLVGGGLGKSFDDLTASGFHPSSVGATSFFTLTGLSSSCGPGDFALLKEHVLGLLWAGEVGGEPSPFLVHAVSAQQACGGGKIGAAALRQAASATLGGQPCRTVQAELLAWAVEVAAVGLSHRIDQLKSACAVLRSISEDGLADSADRLCGNLCVAVHEQSEVPTDGESRLSVERFCLRLLDGLLHALGAEPLPSMSRLLAPVAAALVDKEEHATLRTMLPDGDMEEALRFLFGTWQTPIATLALVARLLAEMTRVVVKELLPALQMYVTQDGRKPPVACGSGAVATPAKEFDSDTSDRCPDGLLPWEYGPGDVDRCDFSGSCAFEQAVVAFARELAVQMAARREEWRRRAALEKEQQHALRKLVVAPTGQMRFPSGLSQEDLVRGDDLITELSKLIMPDGRLAEEGCGSKEVNGFGEAELFFRYRDGTIQTPKKRDAFLSLVHRELLAQRNEGVQFGSGACKEKPYGEETVRARLTSPGSSSARCLAFLNDIRVLDPIESQPVVDYWSRLFERGGDTQFVLGGGPVHYDTVVEYITGYDNGNRVLKAGRMEVRLPWLAYKPPACESSTFATFSYEALGCWPSLQPDKCEKCKLVEFERENGHVTIMEKKNFAAETAQKRVGETSPTITSYPSMLHGGTAKGKVPPLVVIDSLRKSLKAEFQDTHWLQRIFDSGAVLLKKGRWKEAPEAERAASSE